MKAKWFLAVCIVAAMPMVAFGQETAPVTQAADSQPEATTAPAVEEAAAAPATDAVMEDDFGFSADDLSAELDELLEEEEERVLSFGLSGYYRVRGTFLDEPDTYAGSRPKNLAFVQHRLWLSPEIRLNKTPEVKVKADILFGENTAPCQDPSLEAIHTHPCTGLWGANGDNVLSTNTADQIANITVARVWGEALTPVGAVRIGRQASHWGLGLFSNDGQHDQWFGDNHAADTYDRLAFATKPLGEESDLIVALVGDKIVEGSPTLTASGFGNEDDVFEGIGLLLYNTDPIKFGAYQVYRAQKSTSSKIFVSDIYGYLDIGLLYGGFEMLWLYGRTQGIPITSLKGNLDLSYPEVKVNAWAWAGEIGLRGSSYDMIFRLGNVTGDQNGLTDKKVTSYSLNPNYRAGLIMWDYANANRAERALQSSFQTLEALKDAGRATQAQIDELQEVANLQRTRGGINNAFFINPVVKLNPTTDTMVKAGVLWAQANHDIFLINSTNPNSPVGRNYGWEFDLGASYTVAEVFEIGFEAGYLLPGDAFDRVETVKDPATGVDVPLQGATIKADHARLVMFKATWNIDY